METDWTHAGNLLEACWTQAGNETCWQPVVNLLDGNLLQTFWEPAGNLSKVCWKTIGNQLETS
jgi:hypothetical protein